MDIHVYYDKIKVSSALKQTPKAPKKINLHDFALGQTYGKQTYHPFKFANKSKKMELNNPDFIAGIENSIRKILLQIKGK